MSGKRKRAFTAWLFGAAVLGAPPAAAAMLDPQARVFSTLIYDDAAVEQIAYDGALKRVYFLNGSDLSVRALNLAARGGEVVFSPARPIPLPRGLEPVAVAASGGILAVAVVDRFDQLKRGAVLFYDRTHRWVGRMPVGIKPGHMAFTPDGRTLVVSNRGAQVRVPVNLAEGKSRLALRPGSVSIIDLSDPRRRPTVQTRITGRTIPFAKVPVAANGRGPVHTNGRRSLLQAAVPGAIATTPGNREAWVAMPENNAIARLDLRRRTIAGVVPLGVRRFDDPRAGIDIVPDGRAALRPEPVVALHQPRDLAAFARGRRTYIISANTGLAGDHSAPVARLKLDPAAAAARGRPLPPGLLVSRTSGDTDRDGDLDRPHLLGTRSISIWSAAGERVFDSGSAIERLTARALGPNFNPDPYVNGRREPASLLHGPAPSSVEVGEVGGRLLAFVTLRASSGLLMFDVGDPARPRLLEGVTLRNFRERRPLYEPAALTSVGDLGPEGLIFVGGPDSPTGRPLLLIGNKVSGSIRVVRLGGQRRDAG